MGGRRRRIASTPNAGNNSHTAAGTGATLKCTPPPGSNAKARLDGNRVEEKAPILAS
jgi:hypothetical protein